MMIHIGHSRTGTTTLQRHLFPELRDCVHVSRWGKEPDPVYAALLENLRDARDDEFSQHTIRAFLIERMRGRPGTLVLSDESLSGGAWKGRTEPERTAERLHRVASEAKILICVRHQGSRLRSLYSLYVKRGGYGTFHQFLDHAAPGFDLDLDRLCYDPLVTQYRSLFGPDRVMVVAFEQFVRDPAAYLAEIAAFVPAQLPPSLDAAALTVQNPGLSARSRVALRSVNRLFRRTDYNPRPLIADVPAAHDLRARLGRVDRRLPRESSRLNAADEALIDALLPRFAASNATLVRLTALPLGDLGYPLPD